MAIANIAAAAAGGSASAPAPSDRLFPWASRRGPRSNPSAVALKPLSVTVSLPRGLVSRPQVISYSPGNSVTVILSARPGAMFTMIGKKLIKNAVRMAGLLFLCACAAVLPPAHHLPVHAAAVARAAPAPAASRRRSPTLGAGLHVAVCLGSLHVLTQVDRDTRRPSLTSKSSVLCPPGPKTDRQTLKSPQS
mgnify:CR=1 FL=1